MEPITGILAAVSAANAAFGAVKKLVATGREIQDVAGQIGKWYGAFGDFNRLANEKANKKPSVFKRLLHDDSIENEALQITMHKQALIKQEYELKILIVAHYGESVYNEMIMERIRLKKEREHRLRQKEFMLNVKYGAGIAFVATALIGVGYYLLDKVQQ
jgi:hypothetical protein